MKTFVYIDGFNLYYRALKGTAHKWLNLEGLCRAVLPSACDIAQINYYTARVTGRINPNSPKDQHAYLRALGTLESVRIHYGSFQTQDKWMRLAEPLGFRPPGGISAPLPRYAKVIKTEEKGSDVNLGVHLLRDALTGAFEHAAVITNDTDLAEPLRIVSHECGKPITLISPVSRPAQTLVDLVSHVRHLDGYLSGNQLPATLQDLNGRAIVKPSDW
ncbi:NYN domain-containing protein [Limnobacter sp.]|uniref:NYN domain-containing protein n=1 Tax=Limnobacter sp. TaxID=2003368 RepID=UPI003516F9D6